MDDLLDEGKTNRYFQECAESLERFGISPELGFVVENPLQSLPQKFSIWEELAKNLKDLIESATLRDEVNKMPFLHHELLQSHNELRFAHTCLTAVLHGYVWMKGEKDIVSTVPRNLAVPVYGISERLGIEPAMRHYTFVLNNWRLLDPNGKLELNNVKTIINLRAGEDESWFFMVGLQMELEAASGLCAIVRAQKAVNEEENEVGLLTDCLGIMASSISRVDGALRRIHERCRPNVFYNVLRPYMNGWDCDAFKSNGLKGLIYEGVSTEPKSYSGGSGAQSAILYAFDSALGINQPSSGYNMFYQMLCPAHKEFIETIQSGPSIKEYVLKQKCEKLRGRFNDTVKVLQDLRSYHLQIAARYIILESNRKHRNKAFANQAKAGTGGSDFMNFLKGIRDCTKDTLLENA
ncbi:indoleamine 2,3-dioxygenase 2-like isoform X2 [Antedon mediterranea]|uniref:indoleamine 2,3-dioxygenase 2-like isoform X2 n=1 Tax=Antedon mediterranea TaxID=105859 RepID=UPI003AF96BA2